MLLVQLAEQFYICMFYINMIFYSIFWAMYTAYMLWLHILPVTDDLKDANAIFSGGLIIHNFQGQITSLCVMLLLLIFFPTSSDQKWNFLS